MNHIPDSFDADPSVPIAGPRGQVAHPDHIDHNAQFERAVHRVRDGVWSVVGNGLSNQNFVEGPDGLIAIDTGESIQEMQWSLDAIAEHASAPVVAVIYTHSHYVGGTAAIAGAGDSIPVWGHQRIASNREHTGMELSASATRGAIHQFGLLLDTDGPDGLVNVGLGTDFRRAEHAPHEIGFVEPTNLVGDEPTEATIAGLRVEFTPAPSDADDSVTIWFPELDTAVHNIAWPVLFNIFAIRGEPFREPRTLIGGLDHLASLDAAHLVGAHGQPLTGRADIARDLALYRDSIQFLWDQTVRGVNKGLTLSELCAQVQLPAAYAAGLLTQQRYGIAEHHVRQIHHGLVGWFDGDEAQLLQLPTPERSARMVAGFGGEAIVRSQIEAALAEDDLRWAIEMGSWLVRRPDATDDDRQLLARALRRVGQGTTSANLRNWCVTRARELEGSLDLDRFRVHVFAKGAVLGAAPSTSVHACKVLIDPVAAAGVDDHLSFTFPDGTIAGLHVRHQVAVPTDGSGAELDVAIDLDSWSSICSGRLTFSDAIARGAAATTGERERIDRVLACFDHPGLAG